MTNVKNQTQNQNEELHQATQQAKEAGKALISALWGKGKQIVATATDPVENARRMAQTRARLEAARFVYQDELDKKREEYAQVSPSFRREHERRKTIQEIIDEANARIKAVDKSYEFRK